MDWAHRSYAMYINTKPGNVLQVWVFCEFVLDKVKSQQDWYTWYETDWQRPPFEPTPTPFVLAASLPQKGKS